MAKPTQIRRLGDTSTTINMTIEQYLEYIMYLIRNNTTGVELETLLLAIINERCPDALNRILVMAKEGLPAINPAYKKDGIILYKLPDTDEERTGTIVEIMHLSNLLRLEGDIYITFQDVTQILS